MNTVKFKGGARFAAMAGLGLSLAFGVAPATAMATDDAVPPVVSQAEEQPTYQPDNKRLTINSDAQLQYALEHQDEYAGATDWQFGPGEFNWPARTDIAGNLQLNAPVSLYGDGSGTTVIKGHVWYSANDNDAEIKVSNIKFVSRTGDEEVALQWSNSAALTNSSILVEDCTFEGWKYGVQLCNGSGNALTIDNTFFDHNFCAVSVNSDGENRLVMNNSWTYASSYAVQDFDLGDQSALENYYYKNGEDYSNKLNAVDASDVKVPDTTEAALDGENGLVFGTLEKLVESIEKSEDGNGTTVYLNRDVALDKGENIDIAAGAMITIVGNGHTIKFHGSNGGEVFNENTSMEGLKPGTWLQVTDLTFENVDSDQGGYAVIVGRDSFGTQLFFNNCTYKNLFCALYSQGFTKNPSVMDEELSLNLNDSNFVDTKYAYSMDTSTEGSIVPDAVNMPAVHIPDGNRVPDEGVQEVLYQAAVTSNGVTKAYKTLTEAIDAANEGDVITLASGKIDLDEDNGITLKKKVTIQGAADGTSVVCGTGTANYSDGLFNFEAGSEGSTLSNFGIEYNATGAQRAAVYFGYGFTGGSADNMTTIQGVTFKGASSLENIGTEQAIAISSTYTTGGFVKITGCTIENFAYGMYFNGIHDLTIEGNTINGTKYNAINIAGDNSGCPCTDIEIENNTLSSISAADYPDDTYSSGINIGANASDISIAGNSISMLNDKKPLNFVESESAQTCMVTYQVDGADYAVMIGAIDDGKVSFDAPEDPSKSGYTFTGWDYGTANVSVANGVVTITMPTDGTAADSFIFKGMFKKNSTVTPPSKPSYKVDIADAEGGEVKVTPASAKKGDTVTIAATPDEGMKVVGVTVKDADGKEIEVEAGEKDGTWTFEMPGSAVTVEVAFADAWENPFSDVSESDWFYASVREANRLGLMKGFEGTDLFGPLSGAFREQAATVMWNWLGEGEKDAPAAPFADVLQGEWYAPYVNWANEAGVMTGYEGAGTFGVGDPLTREQFASMVARAAGADLDAADASALEGFGDADGVSGWAETAMAWAVENGVISGVELDDGSRALQATRSINRAEMAAMIVNAVQAGVVK